MTESDFVRDKHVKYFIRTLTVLPSSLSTLDTNRMTIAFFALSGLDVLNAIDTLEEERKQMIDWIYSLQVLPDTTESNWNQCGFRGSSTLGHKYDPNEAGNISIPYDSSHIAMTYTALVSLLILGDDFSRVVRAAIIDGLSVLQQDDGSFCAMPEGSEHDMRFVYCAACISYLLDDWGGVDIEKTVQYIRDSLTYEGALGQGPGLEAHGGPTFCGVASLILMDQLDNAFTPKQIERLRRWCVCRQQSGFQGRPNKPVDTCYSFWVGATLQLLNFFDKSNAELNRSFIMETQAEITGGFAKWPHNNPDPLHAYFGICGLSLMREPGLNCMNAALNISERATANLMSIQRRWKEKS